MGGGLIITLYLPFFALLWALGEEVVPVLLKFARGSQTPLANAPECLIPFRSGAHLHDTLSQVSKANGSAVSEVFASHTTEVANG